MVCKEMKMELKKPLKKWGNSLIISFTKEEAKLYGLDIGKVIDVSDMIVK